MSSLPLKPSAALIRRNPHIYGTGFGEALNAETDGKEPKPAKRLRQSHKPLLNKLEAQFLEQWKVLWPGRTIYSQAIRFKLGNGIWYKPDFVTLTAFNGPMAYEIKGPKAFRGGFANLKVVAGLYPEVIFVLAWKENGTWKEQLILP